MKDDSIKTEEKLSESYWWFVGRRAIVDSLLRRLVKRTRVAVDVGCGSGGNLPMLSRYSERVIGLDRSPMALELAASQGMPLACADGEVIPLSDSSVGLVAALDVIEHLDDDLRALREFYRVLQPEGFLLVTVPSYRFLWSEHDEALKHRRRYVASELHAKLTCCGFQVLKRSYAVFFAFFPILVYRLFRGLFPKDPLAPRASYIMLPSVLNNLLIGSLRFEAGMMRVIDIPLGTSVVMLAQKIS